MYSINWKCRKWHRFDSVSQIECSWVRDRKILLIDLFTESLAADPTITHAAISTQTTIATIKKKIPFDDAAGALTKLAIGKKMRTVNPRVPPNTGAHPKDDGNNTASTCHTCPKFISFFCLKWQMLWAGGSDEVVSFSRCQLRNFFFL